MNEPEIDMTSDHGRSLINQDFIEAARDYRMLLDKGYPVDASLKLVGDRWRLSHLSRMMLYRGILSTEASTQNAAKLVSLPPEGASMAIDGYNILFTLTNYLHGHPMFIATDGLLRDVGGAHGRIADHRGFERMARLLLQELARLRLGSITIFLDAPVSSSGNQAGYLRSQAAGLGLGIEVRLENATDHFLAAWQGDILCTADSAIVSRTGARVFDLARHVLEQAFKPRFLVLSEIC